MNAQSAGTWKEQLDQAADGLRMLSEKAAPYGLNVIVEKANKVIKQIAEADKYDILFQEPVVFISPRVDITDKVLKALNK